MRDPRFDNGTAWEQHDRATPEQIEGARANARALAGGPADTSLLEHAKNALEQRPGIWHAFHEALVAAVRETPERQEAWSRALKEAFATARSALATSVVDKMDARELKGISQRWREARDPFSVWSQREPHLSLYRDNLWYWGGILLRVQPLEGLRALDTLPYPGLMKEVLYRYCRDDRDLIEELIQAAPPVFDEGGSWGSERSVAALLAVDLVTVHAQALHNALSYAIQSSRDKHQDPEADAALKDLEERELPKWMSRAFGVLFQRKDGLRIAIGYSGNLSRQKLLGREPRRYDKEHWISHEAALGALADTLRHVAVSVARVREEWHAAEQIAAANELEDAKRNRVQRRSSGRKGDQEGEGARTLRAYGLPLLFGAAMMLGGAPTSEAELSLFWSWFEDLLEGRDRGLSLIRHGTSRTEVPQRFGFLLSRLPDPGALLRTAYEKLEAQRRRALFAHRYDEIYPDLESIVLLRVGLNAASNWLDRVKEGEQAEAARALFFWIYERARRLWLTAVLDTEDSKRQLVISCFAYMPFLFGEKSLGEALQRVIPPIANDARMIVDACANLRLNGIEPAELRALIAGAGAELEVALRDVQQWSELTDREEGFPERLRDLARELGIQSGALEDR